MRVMGNLPRPPSEYYGMHGIQALLFDEAIQWGMQHMPAEKPAPNGLTLRG